MKSTTIKTWSMLILLTMLSFGSLFGQVDDDPVFQITEIPPSFPGGEAALFRFLVDSIRYPEFARDNGIQGTVYIGFVIEKDGKVSNVEVKRGIPGGKVLDDEALRVVKKMPRWEPGRQDGKRVRTSYTMPIKFGLDNGPSKAERKAAKKKAKEAEKQAKEAAKKAAKHPKTL